MANAPVGVTGSRGTFNSRSRIREIGEAAAQIREGIGPDGDWMIDVHIHAVPPNLPHVSDEFGGEVGLLIVP